MPTTLLSVRFPRFDPAPAAMVIAASSHRFAVCRWGG